MLLQQLQRQKREREVADKKMSAQGRSGKTDAAGDLRFIPTEGRSLIGRDLCHKILADKNERPAIIKCSAEHHSLSFFAKHEIQYVSFQQLLPAVIPAETMATENGPLTATVLYPPLLTPPPAPPPFFWPKCC